MRLTAFIIQLYKVDKLNGDIIWNTTLQELQVFDQDSFKTISYTSRTLVATASVGTVQVTASGNITVEVGE